MKLARFRYNDQIHTGVIANDQAYTTGQDPALPTDMITLLANLNDLKHHTIKLRITMKEADLYSFKFK